MATLLTLKLITDRMPDYGIKRGWKKLVLHILVPDEVPKISVSRAQAIKDSVIFLDTRSTEEYTISHIEGARFVGYNEFDAASLKDIPKDQAIITYCSIGKRSGEIGKKLIAAGYQTVQNLYGGVFEWVNNGYKVVNAKEKPTEKVHIFSKYWSKWLERGEKVK